MSKQRLACRGHNLRDAMCIWLLGLTLSALANGQQRSDLTPAQVFRLARESVVMIVTSDQGNEVAQGSGFIIGKDRIVTNHHVIADMTEAFVLFADGRIEPVTGIVADSPNKDVGILQARTGGRNALALGDEVRIHEGDPIVAIGAPRGLELTISNGIVSGFRNANEQFLIQGTAPIAPGSSGGPLLDSRGYVVGITTSLLTDSPGIYFSVGIGDVKRLLKSPAGVVMPFPAWSKGYYPLSVGLHWEYSGLGGVGGSSSTRVDGTEIIRGKQYYRIVTTRGDQREISYQRTSPEGVWKIRGEWPEYLVLAFPLRPGTTWVSDTPGGSFQLRVEGIEDVQLPKQRYRDCLRIVVYKGEGSEGSLYLAPNVGMVKLVWKVADKMMEEDLDSTNLPAR